MTTPVIKVNGIGSKTAEFLKGKRITTVEALVKSGIEKLALAPGFNEGRAVIVINEAGKLIGEPQLKVPSQSTAKSSSKVKTESENLDKKDKKDKNKKGKGKGKKGKKDKKNKKKDKKKNKK